MPVSRGDAATNDGSLKQLTLGPPQERASRVLRLRRHKVTHCGGTLLISSANDQAGQDSAQPNKETGQGVCDTDVPGTGDVHRALIERYPTAPGVLERFDKRTRVCTLYDLCQPDSRSRGFS